jgi:hypothetical protein
MNKEMQEATAQVSEHYRKQLWKVKKKLKEATKGPSFRTPSKEGILCARKNVTIYP